MFLFCNNWDVYLSTYFSTVVTIINIKPPRSSFMLTTYVLNQNNILSNYSKPKQTPPVKSQLSNKQVEKIVRQQDIVVNRFIDTLDNNIQNYLIGNIGKSSINFFLPIKNALWQLWNESWFLGQINAAEELRAAKFTSSSDELIKFNNDDDLLRADRKKRREEAKRTYLIEKLKGFNDKYKTGNEFDDDKIRKYVESTGRKNVTPELIARYKDELVKDEEDLFRRLNNSETPKAVKQKIDKKERVAKKQIKKASNVTNDKKELTNEEREQLKDKYYEGRQTENEQIGKVKPVKERKEAKVDNKQYKFPSNKSSNEAYEQVQQLREQQEETLPSNLEQTSFGQAYLDKRFSTIANVSKESFNQSFSTRLNEIIPDYFNDNRPDKDKSYVTKIRRMYISDTRNIDEYKQKDNYLTKIISSYKKVEVVDNTENLKRDIGKLSLQLRNTPIKQRQKIADKINELEQELANENKRIKKEIDESEDKSKQFVVISQQYKEKLKLTKDTYSIKELNQIRSDVRKQIRQQDQNFYNTKRIALTELNAAYNLGRLDYYQNNNIDYVRWEVSVEHKRRELNNTNKNDAGTIRSYNSTYYGNLAGNYKGSVCPVCWERNGKEFSIDEVTSNPELQIPVHPFCACILVPVTDKDDNDKDRKKKIKLKKSELLNNSVLKWAAGAGLLILGTAAMYAAFRMTRRNPIQPTIAEQTPQVTKIIPKKVKAPEYIKRIADETIETIIENEEQLIRKVKAAKNVKIKPSQQPQVDNDTNEIVDDVANQVDDSPSLIDVARENQDEILEQLPRNLDDIDNDVPIPLDELQPKSSKLPELRNQLDEEFVYVDPVPLNIPTKTVDIKPYEQQVNRAINQDYLDEVGDVLDDAIRQRNNFNTVNPASVVSIPTRNELDEITERLQGYKEYVRSALTKEQRNAIIKQYRNDIRQVNNIINKYEQDNVLIYTEIRTLMSLREEGISKLTNVLGEVDDDIATIFGSTNIGRQINQELIDLERILINRYDDLNVNLGGYYNRANEIKSEIVNANPNLILDYLKKIKGTLTTSLSKIRTNDFNINYVDRVLNELEVIFGKTGRISDKDFFYYSSRLDELTKEVKTFEKQITKTLLDVDLKSLIKQMSNSPNPDNDLLIMAIVLSDYRNIIKTTYNRINSLNVNLITKFNSSLD